MSNQPIKIFTIGFTGSSAQHFFERLSNAGAKKIIDTRLWATSQLAGFAQKKDLPFFLKEIAGIGYEYGWQGYEQGERNGIPY